MAIHLVARNLRTLQAAYDEALTVVQVPGAPQPDVGGSVPSTILPKMQPPPGSRKAAKVRPPTNRVGTKKKGKELTPIEARELACNDVSPAARDKGFHKLIGNAVSDGSVSDWDTLHDLLKERKSDLREGVLIRVTKECPNDHALHDWAEDLLDQFRVDKKLEIKPIPAQSSVTKARSVQPAPGIVASGNDVQTPQTVRASRTRTQESDLDLEEYNALHEGVDDQDDGADDTGKPINEVGFMNPDQGQIPVRKFRGTLAEQVRKRRSDALAAAIESGLYRND